MFPEVPCRVYDLARSGYWRHDLHFGELEDCFLLLRTREPGQTQTKCESLDFAQGGERFPARTQESQHVCWCRRVRKLLSTPFLPSLQHSIVCVICVDDE